MDERAGHGVPAKGREHPSLPAPAATKCDLTDQTFTVRGIIQMRSGSEQPVAKCAGRIQVGGGEGNTIGPKYVCRGHLNRR